MHVVCVEAPAEHPDDRAYRKNEETHPTNLYGAFHGQHYTFSHGCGLRSLEYTKSVNPCTDLQFWNEMGREEDRQSPVLDLLRLVEIREPPVVPNHGDVPQRPITSPT